MSTNVSVTQDPSAKLSARRSPSADAPAPDAHATLAVSDTRSDAHRSGSLHLHEHHVGRSRSPMECGAGGEVPESHHEEEPDSKPSTEDIEDALMRFLAQCTEADVLNAAEWAEFTKAMCDEVNEGTMLCLMGVSDGDPICARVPELKIRQFFRVICGLAERATVAVSAAGVPTTHGTGAVTRSELATSCRLMLTTPENVLCVARCTAVHERNPSLRICKVDNEIAFVLDLFPLLYRVGQRLPPSDSPALVDSTGSSGGPFVVEVYEAIRRFISGVVDGTVRKARMGAPPPPGDALPTVHGVTLRHALCGVTCSFQRLKSANPRGAVCVFWSDRCPCCPGVLRLLDAVIHRVLVATEPLLREDDGSALRQPPFDFIVCNIDDNELSEFDWPPDEILQVVPTVVTYRQRGSERTRITSRSPENLVAAFCDAFLEPLPNAKDLRAAAVKAVHGVDADAIMCGEGDAYGDATITGESAAATAEVGLVRQRSRSRSPDNSFDDGGKRPRTEPAA